MEHNVSPQRFLRWRVSPDFEHAFAAEPETADRSVTYYLDLGANSCVPVGGQSLPVWEFDGRYAFRTVDFGEPGVWLCRFDTEGAEETKLLKIPRGGHLASLSARGRFALVRLGRFRMSSLSLVDVATGNRRRLDTSALSSLFGTIFDVWHARFPWVSVWSPDERRFLMHSLAIPDGSLRTHMWSVPDDWLISDKAGPVRSGEAEE